MHPYTTVSILSTTSVLVAAFYNTFIPNTLFNSEHSFQIVKNELTRSCSAGNYKSLMENGDWSDFKMFDNLTHTTKWMQFNYTGNFQPKNCQKHTYTKQELNTCFKNKTVSIFGDSRSRTIYKVLKSRFQGSATVTDSHFGVFPLRFDGPVFDGVKPYNIEQLSNAIKHKNKRGNSKSGKVNQPNIISYTWTTHFSKMQHILKTVLAVEKPDLLILGEQFVHVFTGAAFREREYVNAIYPRISFNKSENCKKEHCPQFDLISLEDMKGYFSAEINLFRKNLHRGGEPETLQGWQSC